MADEEYFPGLDTLRASAVTLVMINHSRARFGREFIGETMNRIASFGWIGVDLFFVLSGFLIGMQLFRSLSTKGHIDFKQFYLKRAFRILPAFWTVLLLYYVWPDFREVPNIDAPWKFLLFVMNFGRDYDGFSHAWSLCVEEHFYLLMPLIAFSVVRSRMKRPELVLLGSFVLTALLRVGLWAIDAPFYPAVYRPTPTHLDGLIIGVGLAALRVYQAERWARVCRRPWPFFVIGLVLVTVGFRILEGGNNPLGYVFCFSLLAIGFGALVIAAISPGFWLAKWKIPGMALMSSLAYTLYLTHKQMMELTKKWVGLDHAAKTWVTAVGLVFLASLLIHYGIEKPFLRLRERFLKR